MHSESRQPRRRLTVPLLPRPINTGNLIRELWPRHSTGNPMFQWMTDRASQRARSVQRYYPRVEREMQILCLSGIERLDGTRALTSCENSKHPDAARLASRFYRARYPQNCHIPPPTDRGAWHPLIPKQKSINWQKSSVVKLITIINRPEVSRHKIFFVGISYPRQFDSETNGMDLRRLPRIIRNCQKKEKRFNLADLFLLPKLILCSY